MSGVEPSGAVAARNLSIAATISACPPSVRCSAGGRQSPTGGEDAMELVDGADNVLRVEQFQQVAADHGIETAVAKRHVAGVDCLALCVERISTVPGGIFRSNRSWLACHG